MTPLETIDALRTEIAALRLIIREYEAAHDHMRAQRDEARRDLDNALVALERVLAGEA